MIGKTLSHFKVTAKLGEGGMGEVYRATDTKLDREVAIKALPEAFNSDPERLARFEREAKVLASLNHPHISGIHGLEELDGKKFLILELVEGDTIAERIGRGPVPIDEALGLAKQMAEGLEAAHEMGIVHRDFKPANIKVTPEGQIKILDFGLAKVWDSPASASGDPLLSQSPTLTAQMTGMGVILGTASYMSPEQARGDEADKRTDIWAFGCVLFEMLTGGQTYGGRTLTDVLGAIVHKEPEWEELPKDLPPKVRSLLERCLEKESRMRIRDIGEVRILLSGDLEAPVDSMPIEAGVMTSSKGVGLWKVAAVVLLLSTVATAFLLWRQVGAPKQVIRSSILPPEGTVFHLNTARPGPVAVSPDGKQLAFTAVDEEGTSMLWVRGLDAASARSLTGTAGAQYPFWSPDSRSIAFAAQGKLKKVEAAGSPPVALCETEVGKGGSWNRDGVIVFAPSFNTPLHKVSAGGGESTPVTELDTEAGVNSHRHPRFLPDGNRFLYLARTSSGDDRSLRVGSLDGTVSKKLILTKEQAEYAAGHLLFTRDRTLMAQPFDPEALEFTGDAFPLVENILTINAAAMAVFSATSEGLLAYQSGTIERAHPLLWLDRNGRVDGQLGDESRYSHVALSPDESKAVVGVLDDESGNGDLWIFDVARGLRSRFTFDSADDSSAEWSPDGERIYFASNRGGDYDIYEKSVGGGKSEELLLAKEGNQWPGGLARDGQYLIFTDAQGGGRPDVWALPLRDGGDPFAVLETEFAEGGWGVSPDGRWLAYTSNESGESEVYVTAFPKPEGKWQVSLSGGDEPNWRRDGKEIFYRDPSGKIISAEVSARGDDFQIGAITELFTVEMSDLNDRRFYPTADGQRFLAVGTSGDQTSSPIHLIVNWTEELKRRR
ncbi:MAG: protein kinase [Thermoanaerobaculia bacterium]